MDPNDPIQRKGCCAAIALVIIALAIGAVFGVVMS